MDNKLFRQKSIDRVSSPEHLNDYIKVSSPGAWMVLAAALVLLVGAFAWGIAGRLETTVPAVVASREGEAVCCYDAAFGAQVEAGMSVRVDGAELRIEAVSPAAEELPADMAAGGYAPGQSVFAAGLEGTLPEGTYEAEIVVERIAPAAFLWN